MSMKLTAGQLARGRRRLSDRKRVPESAITDAMVLEQLSVGGLSMRDCGAAGVQPSSDSSSSSDSGSGGSCE